MDRKIFLTFSVSMVVIYFATHSFFKVIEADQEKDDSQQMQIILENVQDRFRMFFELPLSIGFMGADHFSTGNILKKEYGPFANTLLKIKKEVLGLSIVNFDGKIVRVYPGRTNPDTLGKISQNIKELKQSNLKKDKFWLSPPFKLYQGMPGFAVYFPIINKDQFRGWFATVMNTDLFYKTFRLDEFLSFYDLIIRDKKTGLEYFSTALPPENLSRSYSAESKLGDRVLVFTTWKKHQTTGPLFHPYMSLFIALLASILIVIMMKIYQQRKREIQRIDDINILLRLSAREALHNLVDIQSGNGTQEIASTTNLIEQIDLLQTMTLSKRNQDIERLRLLDLLEEQLESLTSLIDKKQLKIIFHAGNLGALYLNANRSLIENSVLINILTHSIIYSEKGGRIKITSEFSNRKNYVTFFTEKLLPQTEKKARTLDRRLEVAKKALHIYRGELYLQNDLAEGMIIRIVLPE